VQLWAISHDLSLTHGVAVIGNRTRCHPVHHRPRNPLRTPLLSGLNPLIATPSHQPGGTGHVARVNRRGDRFGELNLQYLNWLRRAITASVATVGQTRND
jgi:hypothetical protein